MLVKKQKAPRGAFLAELAPTPKIWEGNCVSSEGVATLKGIECLFINILRTVLPLAGLAVGVMFVVGGFQLITAGGEAEGIKKAKNTFTYAIGGLLAVILVWFVLVFIENFTGLKVTQFELK